MKSDTQVIPTVIHKHDNVETYLPVNPTDSLRHYSRVSCCLVLKGRSASKLNIDVLPTSQKRLQREKNRIHAVNGTPFVLQISET